MPAKRVTPTQSAAATSPRDQTWRHYSEIMDKFRKLCHSDKVLFQQAEDKIKAKRVAEAYQRHPRDSVDPFSIAEQMTKYELDTEDQKQVDALYRRKLDFRDRLCCALGKLDDERWDSFFARYNTTKAVPHTVRQFELMAEKP